MRGLQRLPPGLLSVSGEQPELLCVTQHSKRCCCSWEEKRPSSFRSIIQWLELPGAPAGARGKSWRKHLAIGWPGLEPRWEPGGERGSLACASAGNSGLCLGSMVHGPCLLLFTPELSVQPPGPGPGLGLTASLQTQSMLLSRGEMLAQGRQAEQVNMRSPGGKHRLFWYHVGLDNLSSLRLAPIFPAIFCATQNTLAFTDP